MTTAATPTLAVPSLDAKVKMEDRKRSLAPDADDAAPRPKRQRDENMRMDTEREAAVEVCLARILLSARHFICASNIDTLALSGLAKGRYSPPNARVQAGEKALRDLMRRSWQENGPPR